MPPEDLRRRRPGRVTPGAAALGACARAGLRGRRAATRSRRRRGAGSVAARAVARRARGRTTGALVVRAQRRPGAARGSEPPLRRRCFQAVAVRTLQPDLADLGAAAGTAALFVVHPFRVTVPSAAAPAGRSKLSGPRGCGFVDPAVHLVRGAVAGPTASIRTRGCEPPQRRSPPYTTTTRHAAAGSSPAYRSCSGPWPIDSAWLSQA